MLNNREIASAIWLSIVLIWALWNPSLRSSVFDLLKSFFLSKLVFVFVCSASYLFFLVACLSQVGFWDRTALKDTVIWGLGATFLVLGHAQRIAVNKAPVSSFLSDGIRWTLVAEYVANFVSFALFVEMFLIPVIGITAVLGIVARQHPKHAQVGKMADAMLGVAGIVLLYFGIGSAVASADWGALRSFLLQPALTLAFLPFVYFTALFLLYESFFVAIRHCQKDAALTKYTKHRVFLECHVNIWKLKVLRSNVGVIAARSRTDVQQALREFGNR